MMSTWSCEACNKSVSNKETMVHFMQNLGVLVQQKMHQPDNRGNLKSWKSKLDLYWMLRAPISSPSVPWESWPHLAEWTRQYTNRGWGQRWRETWRLAGGLLLAPQHVPLKTEIPPGSGQTLTIHPTKNNKIYEEILHWKPIFFNIFKNKTGELFFKCLETTLQPLAENTNHH